MKCPYKEGDTVICLDDDDPIIEKHKEDYYDYPGKGYSSNKEFVIKNITKTNKDDYILWPVITKSNKNENGIFHTAVKPKPSLKRVIDLVDNLIFEKA